MKEKIEQLAKGIVPYELPKILVSEETISIQVETGSTYQGSLSIHNSEGRRMKGVLYSTSRLLCLEEDKFVGEEIQIRYHFCADYLNAGDSYSESISIVSDCGELTVPVSITVEAPYCDSSLGKIKDLFQLANLAKTDWAEAKQVFRSDKFLKVLEYYDKPHVMLYKSLLKSSSVSEALDEFLVATHKKVQITIKADKEEINYDALTYNFMDKLVLTKDSWGYAEIRITTDAPFIELERKILWADNFSGNICDVNFVVKTEHMKDGKHYGHIEIATIHQTITVNVTVDCSRENAKERLEHQKIKELQTRLVQNYLKFRLNKISAGKYVAEGENILLSLLSKGVEETRYDLYHLHLKLIAGNEAVVNGMFQNLEDMEEQLMQKDEVCYGIFLYLKTLRKRNANDAQLVSAKVSELSLKYPKNTYLFWCMLYLDQQYETNRIKKYEDIKQRFMLGMHSPVIYYEAAVLIHENPSLLKTMDAFEQNLLMFCIRYDYMSKEIAAQGVYLAGKGKGYQKLSFYLLVKLYDLYHTKEALQAICSSLIRGRCRSPKYHAYYELGMNQQLRVTELPEYYVYSMREEEHIPIPPTVMTYFNFNNNLPENKKSFYYACLLENCKLNHDIFKQHQYEMLEFVKRQLKKGIFNEHLAVLCDELIQADAIDEETAALLPNVAFQYELLCPNPKIKNVAVVHAELASEVIVPVIDGKAMITLLTEDAQIFLIDASEQRYYITVSYSIKKITHLEHYYEQMYQLVPDQPNLILYLADRAQYYQKFDDAAIDLRKRVALLEHLSPDYQKEFIQTLIHYYYDNFEGELLENYLMQIDLHVIDRANRSKIIEFMIVRDLFPIAFAAMEELGFEGVDVKRILKITSRMVSDKETSKVRNETLLELSYYLFCHGKYEVSILEYLLKHFYGTTAQMLALWQCSRENNLDTSEFEDRLLAQMLFAQSNMEQAKEVFIHYYTSGCNRKLIRAFISYYSYQYLLKEADPEPDVFEIIRKELNYENNDMALYALLKYYSLQDQLSDSEVKFIDYHLTSLEQNNIIFPFFLNFKRNMRIPQNMYDKYYVEYKANPKHKVMIHYVVNGSENNEYSHEEMTNVFCGIYVKEFVLFYNETLDYYITEALNDGETMTEKITICCQPEANQYEENNYQRINQMIQASEQKDDQTVLRLLEAYARMDNQVNQLFQPIEK